ncbi:phosphatase 2C-like domain-containing protein [Scheffersomyces xylosifermentans]|uniref:phosphatase 2C-like domain-containing protein n=1 Tax=Scheffersomyces xylosifermentans TaxID=1304137 RepID=UPI00315CCBE3
MANRRALALYIVIVLVSMLFSFVAKRGIPTVARNGAVIGSVSSAGTRTIARRSFSFSSSSWSPKSTGGSSKSFTTATGAAASASAAAAATNYDNALTSVLHYEVAVAYQPKDREESNLFKKKHNKPSPALESPSGEDNLFVSKELGQGYLAVGVADGVGGWSEAGYDSSAISRELCASFRAKFEASEDLANVTPKQLLSKAFEEITHSPKVEIGGTTACFGILTPDKKLKVSNLGDSWCGLFRDYQLINESHFQTHNFNTPYQLAKIPKQIVRQAELEGRRYIIDSPELADEYVWDLQSGDVIMFATDGVTDNVIPKDIEIFLKDQLDEKSNKLDEVAQLFVKEVVKVSKDTNFPSAFAQELSRLTGQKYLGGKEDDITVVLVKVK